MLEQGRGGARLIPSILPHAGVYAAAHAFHGTSRR